MRFRAYLILIFLGMLLFQGKGHAQEEESAAVSLEEYTDEFQEYFFEALKQKGIENYDKAINLLLDCKRIDAVNIVVDHELAKVYMADQQYIRAQEYAITVVNAEPENLWYLDTLVEIVLKQGSTINAIRDQIPYDDYKLKENLALIYYQRRNYQRALNILKEIKQTSFTRALSFKIRDSLERIMKPEPKEQNPASTDKLASPLENLQAQIADLILKKDYAALEKLSGEAVEKFPSQPFFYYVMGLALNKNTKFQEAINVLEPSLDYLLDDDILANKIYQELAYAYTQLGNTSKANMYLSKIKSGS